MRSTVFCIQVLAMIVFHASASFVGHCKEIKKQGLILQIQDDWEIKDAVDEDFFLQLKAQKPRPETSFREHIRIKTHVLNAVVTTQDMLRVGENLKQIDEGTIVVENRHIPWNAVTLENPEPDDKPVVMMRYAMILEDVAISFDAFAESSQWQHSRETFDTIVKSVRFEKSKENSDASSYFFWRKHALDTYGYELHFPRQPEIEKPSDKTAQKHVALVRPAMFDKLAYICESHQAGEAFDELLKYENDKKQFRMDFLYGLAETKAEMLDGERINKGQKLELGKFLGWDYTIKSKKTVRCRSFIAGNQVTTLMVIGDSEEAVSAKISQKFLESFRQSNPN